MKFVIALFRFLNIKKENPANAFQIPHKASKLAKDASSLWDFISREKKAKSPENIIHEICIYSDK